MHSYFLFRLPRHLSELAFARAECRLRIGATLMDSASTGDFRSLRVLGVSASAADLVLRLGRGGLSALIENNYCSLIERTATFVRTARELRPKLRVHAPWRELTRNAIRGDEFDLVILGLTLETAGSAFRPLEADFGEFGLRRLALSLPGGATLALAPARRIDHLERTAAVA